jgi:hypothetical protein
MSLKDDPATASRVRCSWQSAAMRAGVSPCSAQSCGMSMRPLKPRNSTAGIPNSAAKARICTKSNSTQPNVEKHWREEGTLSGAVIHLERHHRFGRFAAQECAQIFQR